MVSWASHCKYESYTEDAYEKVATLAYINLYIFMKWSRCSILRWIGGSLSISKREQKLASKCTEGERRCPKSKTSTFSHALTIRHNILLKIKSFFRYSWKSPLDKSNWFSGCDEIVIDLETLLPTPKKVLRIKARLYQARTLTAITCKLVCITSLAGPESEIVQTHNSLIIVEESSLRNMGQVTW